MSGREVYLVGLSHKSAPIEVRERVALTGDLLKAALGELKATEGVAEAFVVSTCNRVEVYVQAEGIDPAQFGRREERALTRWPYTIARLEARPA